MTMKKNVIKSMDPAQGKPEGRKSLPILLGALWTHVCRHQAQNPAVIQSLGQEPISTSTSVFFTLRSYEISGSTGKKLQLILWLY